MTKYSVCHEWNYAQSHNRYFVTEICRIIGWNARNTGRNLCRSFSTTSVFISLKKRKLTMKTQETSPKSIWSRFKTIFYGDN